MRYEVDEGIFEIAVARREKQKAVIGFIGPSGSGKTVSALRLAYGMMKEAYPDADEKELWSKIGVADTEHKRALLYWNEQFGDMRVGEFLHIDFTPPYTTDRYNAAVQALKKTGCEVIIVDSLSHNWQGKGGIIETHSNMTGNSFQNWGKLSSETTSLIETLTTNNVHVICTMRTKTEYVVELNEHGKMAPRKVGTKPVQKDEFEYEFMINFIVNMEGVSETSKDNTRLFEGESKIITEEDGGKLYRWVELGVDVKSEEEAKRAAAEEERQALIHTIQSMVSADPNLESKVTNFEFKANQKLENFSKVLLKTAIERLKGEDK
ncbi:hypothetical protein NCCP2331_16340 [Sporosarcina sp. NCCP-2331]|nr:hypothetical protein NCCP2331_16340 [Sporosarcina sp. NCCP-2331]GLB55605.1 hypothetical protein NCCP2378_13920 [Sporosarcina sp. NCCP-2378]